MLGCRAASCPGDRPRQPEELMARADSGGGPWPPEGRQAGVMDSGRQVLILRPCCVVLGLVGRGAVE